MTASDLANNPAHTPTRKRIVEALEAEASGRGAWLSPTAVAMRANIGEGQRNAGGAARSLRILVSAGVVEQRQAGHSGRWPSFEYRIASSTPAAK